MSQEPEDADIIASAIEARLLVLHTTLSGTIKSYNPLTQRADIVLLVNSPLDLSDGSTLHEELPILPNVPIKWMRAGGFIFHWPLSEGDFVEVTFHEADLSQWLSTGQKGDVADRRRFDLSNATAAPSSAWPLSMIISPEDATDPGVVLNGPGTVRIGSLAASVFVALAPLVDARILAIQMAFDAHIHATGVGPSGPPAAPIGALGSVTATKLKAQ